MNVREYFEEKLQTRAEDEEGLWDDIPIDSPCGDDCKKAIDHATGLAFHINQSMGDGLSAQILLQDLIKITARICDIYIYG